MAEYGLLNNSGVRNGVYNYDFGSGGSSGASGGGMNWGSIVSQLLPVVMNMLQSQNGGSSGNTTSSGNTAQGSIPALTSQAQSVFATPQNLFQYQPSGISASLKEMLKQRRGF